MFKQFLSIIVIGLLPLGVAVFAYPAPVSAETTFSICHGTNSATNPYTQTPVDQHAADGSGGEGDHFNEHDGRAATSQTMAEIMKAQNEQWGDIIPPIPGTLAYEGLNWIGIGESMWLNDCNYVSTITEVTAPTFTGPSCDVDGSYLIPSTAGVKYYIGETLVEPGLYVVKNNISVALTAKADQGYYIDELAVSSWSYQFLFPSLEDCILGTESVTPAPVTFINPACDTKGSYTIPSINGVQYRINSQVVPAGTYPVNSDTTINFTATPLPGFDIEGVFVWSHQFITPTDCVLGAQSVTPAPVIFVGQTCTKLGSYTIPFTYGVDYFVNGKALVAGVYTANSGDTVIVSAIARDGFQLKSGVTSQWVYTFSLTDECGSVLGDSTTTPNTLPFTSGDRIPSNFSLILATTFTISTLGFIIRKLAMS